MTGRGSVRNAKGLAGLISKPDLGPSFGVAYAGIQCDPTNARVTLSDGSYHDLDADQIAAVLAWIDGFAINAVDEAGRFVGAKPSGEYVAEAPEPPPALNINGEIWGWDGSAWVDIRSADEIAADVQRDRLAGVRAEASRRMQALVGARDASHLDIIIANASREAIRLLRLGEANWTAEQAARAAQLEAVDAAIEAIRAASNVLEAMDSIPADYADDSYWVT